MLLTQYNDTVRDTFNSPLRYFFRLSIDGRLFKHGEIESYAELPEQTKYSIILEQV